MIRNPILEYLISQRACCGKIRSGGARWDVKKTSYLTGLRISHCISSVNPKGGR